MIINFLKVENTGKAVSQWDDSVIGVYHKEKVYDGGIKTTVNNSHLTISSNNTEVVFEDYDYTDKYHIRFMGNASDRLYNIQKQIEQGKITVEKTVMEKAEEMFKSNNDKEKDSLENKAEESVNANEKNANTDIEEDYDDGCDSAE